MSRQYPLPRPRAVRSRMRRRSSLAATPSLRRQLYPAHHLAPARVMVAASDDLYSLILADGAGAVHDAMVAGNAPRPLAAQITAKRLGLADALERVSPDVSQENVDPTRDILISFLPI